MFTKAEIIELSRLQRELDQLILSNIKKDSHAILNNKIIALIVELSEFINEHQGFKY
jgi:dimeric dUTPase (all-alpha-NTP-PPase superfamily)